jgi:hypothetical protein
MSLVTVDTAFVQRLFSAGRTGISQIQTMIQGLGLAALQGAVSWAVPDPLSGGTLTQLLLQSETLASACPFPEDEPWIPELIKPNEIDAILAGDQLTRLVQSQLTFDVLSGSSLTTEPDLNHLLDLFDDIDWSHHQGFLSDAFFNDRDFMVENHHPLRLAKAKFDEIITKEAGKKSVPEYLSQRLREKLVIFINTLREQPTAIGPPSFLQRAYLHTTYILALLQKIESSNDRKNFLASLALQGCQPSALSLLITTQSTLDGLLNDQLLAFDPKFYELRMRFAFETLRLKIIEETDRAKKRELDETFQNRGRHPREINPDDLSLIQLLLALRFYPFNPSTTLKTALLWHGDEFSALRSQMHKDYIARLAATIEDIGKTSFSLWLKSFINGHPTLKDDRKSALLSDQNYEKFYPLFLVHLGILKSNKDLDKKIKDEWVMA